MLKKIINFFRPPLVERVKENQNKTTQTIDWETSTHLENSCMHQQYTLLCVIDFELRWGVKIEAHIRLIRPLKGSFEKPFKQFTIKVWRHGFLASEEEVVLDEKIDTETEAQIKIRMAKEILPYVFLCRDGE